MYLMIRNTVAEIPTIGMLTTLGLSSSRGREETVGQFGSGKKYMLALFARKGLISDFKETIGDKVYTYFTKEVIEKDSRGIEHTVNRIYMKEQNGATYDLNIADSFGAMDWTSVDMALRELVSNAIDGQITHTGNARDVTIEVVENARRPHHAGKNKYICAFIPMTRSVERYYEKIKDNFICLRYSYDPKSMVIEKESQGPARIYRKGVLVGEFGDMSLFDYNLPDVDLKESRIVDSYEAQRCAGRALISSDAKYLAEYLKHVTNENSNIWECSIDKYYFGTSSYKYNSDEFRDKVKNNYKKAYEIAYRGAVACRTANEARMIRAKGKEAVIIESTEIYNSLKDCEAETVEAFLNDDEREGRVIVPTLPEHINTLKFVWSKIVEAGLHANKDMPNLKSFTRTEMHDNRDAYGLYVRKDQTILMNADHVSGPIVVHTLIHECGHHITQADDCSLPMQEFGMRLAAALMGAPK